MNQAGRKFLLRCFGCGDEIEDDSPQPRCDCAEPGPPLIVEPDLEIAGRTLGPESLATRPATLMRYRELLPFFEREPALMPLVTPVVAAPALADELELGAAFVKDEGCQPSGSLKARPSAVAVARAHTLGFDTIACASSGNAAISLAAMAAAEGLKAVVFVSDRIPRPKLAQLQAYDPRVVVVRAPYEAAYALCDDACWEFGWYNRNCAQDPFLVEGKKTCGLEIAEQTAADPPDWVVVPVGDGCTIAGIWKGLREAKALGISGSVPRMLAVQARGAATVHDAWAEDRPPAEVESRYAPADTTADSIAVTHPHNGGQAVAALRESAGAAVTVTDSEMRTAMLDIARSGVLVEPASAAGLAGVRSARDSRLIEAGARVVLVGTGTGLKALDEVAAGLGNGPAPIEPTLAALKA